MSSKENTAPQVRLPAEWEPQSAIMLTWPHINTDWRETLSAVEDTYFEIAKAVLSSQNLIISCEDSNALQRACKELRPIAKENGTNISSYTVPADDTWARDHGPISIFRDTSPTLLNFIFNAWGDKYASGKDNLITLDLARQGAFAETEIKTINFILEGGSIECDGNGTLLTTEHCLLQASRNQELSKADIEITLKRELGVSRILWLSAGYLKGDDTDAHIDTLARFVDTNTICYVACNDQSDEHYLPLKEMEAQLKAFQTSEGKPYRLVPLPMPAPVFVDNNRLPATYANFLITNQSVLLPTYDSEQDEAAIAIIQDCFPDRSVIAINCLPLIEQHGSLHCVTMQLHLQPLKGNCV